MIVKSQRSLWFMLACLTFLAQGASFAAADENDPPSRVARLAYAEGSVSFQPAGTSEWVEPPINRPVTTGDQLWSDRDSRAELQLDGSSLRLSANTAVSLLNLSDTVTQIQLSSGTLLVRVLRLDDDETYEIDTPNLAFNVLRPGLYRISVDGTGNSTAVLVRRGQGEVTGGGTAYPIGENEYDVFSGTDELRETAQNYTPDQDAFDAWSAARDARWEHSVSAQYVSPDVVGYEDLDDQGSWTAEPEYGHVWFPRAVQPGWAPYRTGHWAYIAPWGYTWVDDSSWGFPARGLGMDSSAATIAGRRVRSTRLRAGVGRVGRSRRRRGLVRARSSRGLRAFLRGEPAILQKYQYFEYQRECHGRQQCVQHDDHQQSGCQQHHLCQSHCSRCGGCNHIARV
jgi:hypothetical protein